MGIDMTLSDLEWAIELIFLALVAGGLGLVIAALVYDAFFRRY